MDLELLVKGSRAKSRKGHCVLGWLLPKASPYFAPVSQGLPEGEHSHPNQPAHSKTPQISQEPKGAQATGPDPSLHSVVNRHVQQMEPHLHPSQTSSYPSPVATSVKQELPSSHQAQVPKPALFIPTTAGPGAAPGLTLARSESQSALKQDSAGHPVGQRPVDMVQLLTVSLPSIPGRGEGWDSIPRLLWGELGGGGRR